MFKQTKVPAEMAGAGMHTSTGHGVSAPWLTLGDASGNLAWRGVAVPIFEYSCQACHHEFEMLVLKGTTPACPKCQSETLERLISVPAVKSESTHALAMQAARKRDTKQASELNRAQREYELSHND